MGSRVIGVEVLAEGGFTRLRMSAGRSLVCSSSSLSRGSPRLGPGDLSVVRAKVAYDCGGAELPSVFSAPEEAGLPPVGVDRRVSCVVCARALLQGEGLYAVAVAAAAACLVCCVDPLTAPLPITVIVARLTFSDSPSTTTNYSSPNTPLFCAMSAAGPFGGSPIVGL